MADSELPQYEATQETVETEQTPFEKLLTALPEFGTLLTHYDQFRSFERDIHSNTAAVNELKYEIEVCDKTIETLRKEESSIYDQVEASAPPKSPSMAFGSFFSKGKQPDVNRKATTVHKVDPEHIHTSIEIQQQTKQHLVARLRKLQDVRNDLEAVENELFVFKLQLMRFLDNVFDNATLFDLDDPRFEDHASVMASLTDSEALILEMIHKIENLQRSSELLADAESCIREAKDQLGHISQFEVRFSLVSRYNLPAAHFSGASSKMDMAVYKLETARNVWNDVPPVSEFPGVVFGNASEKDATRLQTQLAESRVKIQAYIAMAQSQIADHQLSLSGAKESRLENAVKLYTLRIEIMEDLMQENGMTVPGMYTGVKPQDLLGSMFTPTSSSVDVPRSEEGGGILTSSFFAKLYAPASTHS